MLKEIIKYIDICYELNAQQTRFVAVTHSGIPSTTYVPKDSDSTPLLKTMELHAKLALKLKDQALMSVIQVPLSPVLLLLLICT